MSIKSIKRAISFIASFLAFDVYNNEQIHSFASKLYVGERSVASFTVSDEVLLKYHEGKSMHMKLSDLLPDFHDSDMIRRIKECLSAFESSKLERLLSLTPMSTKDIWSKISGGLTPAQYLLGIYQTRKINHYYAGYVPYVDLSRANDNWTKDLLDILYDQKVELFDDSFGYRLSPYFKGYFSNDYVTNDEKILPAIEEWADNDNKRSYLVSLGVKTERAKLIQLRKSILNNEPVNAAEIEAQKDNIKSTIKLFASKGLLPFTRENQISAMRMFLQYNSDLNSQCDIDILKSSSSEYGLPEYSNWKSNGKISIYLYEKEIPRKLVYKLRNNSLVHIYLVCKYNEGIYHYELSNKTLYINNKCKVQDILYSLVSDNQVPFDTIDWKKLYLNNLVPKSEVESKDKEIQDLKDELEKYKQRYGSLKKNTEDSLNNNKADDKNDLTNYKGTNEYKLGNDVEVKEHGQVADKDEIDEEDRKDINHDARVAAKKYLESSDYDCSAWDPENSGNLVCGLVRYKGKSINIAVTSSKSRKLYLHPRIFAEIMGNPNNLLLNYGADNRIHSLSFNDIFKDNPNVNLIFDTDVVSPEHIAELANKYIYSRRTCFVIENPKYSSSDTIRSFGLNEKKTDGRVDVDISEDDIFNW